MQRARHFVDLSQFTAQQLRRREHLGGREAVVLLADHQRAGMAFLTGGLDAEDIARATQARGVEAPLEFAAPGRQRVGVGEILGLERRHFQHCLEHRGVDAMGEAIDGFTRGDEVEQQLLELCTGDRGRAFGDAQFGVLDRVVDEVGVERAVVLEVHLVLALLDLVQRRQADVDVAALDQLGHLAVEERQQQRTDVRAVHVGVGHQDDAVVAQLVRVVFVLADAAAQRGDQRAHFGRGQHAVEARALDVEDLALERQDGLGLAVAALLGRATGGVTLDDEQFRQRRILFLAVGQLARQAGDVERTLAAGEVARLARRFARTRGVDDLAGDRARLVRALLQEFLELGADHRFHGRAHFRRDQLFLGLRTEARVGHLHRQHGDHAFAHVVAAQGDLGLLGDAVLLDVVAERTRQGRTETDEMGAAVLLRDVVGEAEHRFLVGVGPLDRDINNNPVLFARSGDNRLMQRGF